MQLKTTEKNKGKSSRISLMFSGGVDSTVTAILLARDYQTIDLLTYNNGYGHYHLERSRGRARELNLKVTEKFNHSIFSVKTFFDEILINTIEQDYKKYRSAFIFCMGCKLAMHTQSIIYNLKNGIRVMSDGSSSSTDEMVEQMLISISIIKYLYEDFGIEYITPVYNIPRDEERKMLKDMGFKMGFRIRDRYLGIQPKCIPGELYYLPYILFNKPPNHEERVIADFLYDKEKIVKRIIEKNLN